MENSKANTCNAVTAVVAEMNKQVHAIMFPIIVPVLCCSILLLSLVLIYSPRHPYRVARG